MTRAPSVVLAVVVSLMLVSSQASAWNDKGHMAVAYVAYKALDQTVRDRADALLKLNPYYQIWRSMIPPNVPAKDRNLAVFMIAATWPDQIKSDGTYQDDGTHGGNRPDGPPSSQNTGYTDKLRHKYWHFVDRAFSPASLPLPPVPDPNAQNRIALFRTVLRGSAGDPLKSYDLTWLLHLIGDVHQPLHCVTRVTAGHPDGDDGGNGVSVCADAPCGTTARLHSVWDGLLGPEHGVAAAMVAAKNLAAGNPQLAGVLDEDAWITESFNLAKSDVYKLPIGGGTGPFHLTSTYRKNAKKIAEARVALAGARMAAVLNKDLK